MEVKKKISITGDELALEASIKATGDQGATYTFFNNDADDYVKSQGYQILQKLGGGTLSAAYDKDSSVTWRYKIHVEKKPELPKPKPTLPKPEPKKPEPTKPTTSKLKKKSTKKKGE